MVVTDQPLANLVALTLDHGKYATKLVHTIGAARQALRDWRPHLLLVDIDPREPRSLDLVGRRVSNRRLPTIALTARGDLATKLAAFEHGADDIVTIPFVPQELVARVLAVMRRTYGDAVPFHPVIKVAGLEIDLLNERVSIGSAEVRLTSIEQALLYLLASNAGQTIGREEILDALWGADFIVGSNVVDRHVRELRVKLSDDWHSPRFIETVAGKGYRFKAQVAQGLVDN